jgi:hypothetical protein
MENHRDLSGLWAGVYDYPDCEQQATPFNAIIHEVSGSFYGQIIEPLLDIDDGGDLYADINGFRDGQQMEFTKTYERFAAEGFDTVLYIGTINDDFSKVEGTWTTVEEGGVWSGPFIMNRVPSEKAQVVSEVEESMYR